MIYAGIDAHKKRCVATLKTERGETLQQLIFENNHEGVLTLIAQLQKHDHQARAVLESTGNYWIRIHDTLEDQNVETLLANPSKTRIIVGGRISLVQNRSMLRNRIHALLAKHGLQPTHDLNTKQGEEWLRGLQLPSK